MICLSCGKSIDDEARVCPYCGSFTEPINSDDYYGSSEANNEYDEYDEYGEYDEYDDEPSDEFTDDDPVYASSKKPMSFKLPKLPKISVPSPKPSSSQRKSTSSVLPVSTVLSIICALLSLFCLITVSSLKKELASDIDRLTSGLTGVQMGIDSVESRLENMDSTIAGVQSAAYNQLAEQSINITKDITPLTGPVAAGKNAIMFIVKAEGNLDVATAFDWQRYNPSTGGWVSVVFTGSATTNEQYGLRIENAHDKNEGYYSSILWANGLTSEAEGSYRCVITDKAGISRSTSEATVQVN